jgi:hypothetical protein
MPFGIITSLFAALAALLGILIFFGLMLIGIDLSLLVDLHEILALLIEDSELIVIVGLDSFVDLTLLILKDFETLI